MKEFVMNKTSPIVETTKGKLRGFRYDGVDHFYGIRYAKAKRFQMPEPVACLFSLYGTAVISNDFFNIFLTDTHCN